MKGNNVESAQMGERTQTRVHKWENEHKPKSLDRNTKRTERRILFLCKLHGFEVKMLKKLRRDEEKGKIGKGREEKRQRNCLFSFSFFLISNKKLCGFQE